MSDAEEGGLWWLREDIVITDVTRMYKGNVCIAGNTGYP